MSPPSTQLRWTVSGCIMHCVARNNVSVLVRWCVGVLVWWCVGALVWWGPTNPFVWKTGSAHDTGRKEGRNTPLTGYFFLLITHVPPAPLPHPPKRNSLYGMYLKAGGLEEGTVKSRHPWKTRNQQHASSRNSSSWSRNPGCPSV